MSELDESIGSGHRLIRELGRGGMGVVYEAWDEQLERRVAVKMLHPYLFADKVVGDRLLREARLAARIEHPNVVRVYGVDVVDGRLAIQMQFIEGDALPGVLAAGPLPGPQAADLLGQTLEALAACHTQGVIHCDLKPGNLLVSIEGRVYLSDFGIAKALSVAEPCQSSAPIASGPLWGTPQYTPPEAWEGEVPSAQWDLYAAGVIIYEALAGHVPFQGVTPLAIMLEKHAHRLEPIRRIRPDLSPEFSLLVDRLVSPDMHQRPVSARDALIDLRDTPEYNQRDSNTAPIQCLPKPVSASISTKMLPNTGSAPSVPSVEMSPRRTPQWQWWLLGALMVMLGAVGGWAAGWWGALRAEVSPLDVPRMTDVLSLTVSGNRVFFSYDDGEHGRELWTTHNDGDPWMVGDLNPGAASSDPKHLFSRGPSELLFAASTNETGSELWHCATGYVEAPTKLIRDIIPGPMGSDPQPLATHDVLALMYATTLDTGRELWATNGREGQTALVRDLTPGPGFSQPMSPTFHDAGDHVYLIAFTQEGNGMTLLRYDFATNSVKMISQVDNYSMQEVKGKLFFDNRKDDTGRELWMHDPATGETALFLDIVPGVGSSNPGGFFGWKDRLYFQATTENSGSELWVSDGTPVGTHLLMEINSQGSGSDPFGFIDAGDFFFFKATSEAHGMELYKGSEGGIALVADLFPGPNSSVPYNFSVTENMFFFSADDGAHGEELWMLDMQVDGGKPKLVADLVPGPGHAGPHDSRWVAPGLGYFVVTSPDNIQKLYRIQRKDAGWKVEALRLPVARGETKP